METRTTETAESSDMLPVTSTVTPETLDQSTLPVVDHLHTTETLGQSQSPPLGMNMLPAETSQSQVTNTQETEQTTIDEVTNTHESESAPLGESTPPPVTNTQTAETVDQSTLPPMEDDTKTTETVEHSNVASDVTDNSHANLIASLENQQSSETRQETVEEEEEVRTVLKDIAATGEFWSDWEKLRSMLSLHLKQVISEYPQAKMTIEEQKISLGETLAELVNRLDDALHSFIDGPPFTLQRLSEIILDARTLYPNLSKLALALEKNLSVTSTLTASTNPHPSLTTPNGSNKVTQDPNPNSNPQLRSDAVMENGALTEAIAADRDEIMTEVDADVSDVMTMDVETTEKPPEPSPMTTGDS